MLVRRHLNTSHHRLPVTYFACEEHARSVRMFGILLCADNTKMDWDDTKCLAETRVPEH
jgi:hypothetical protein